MDVGHEIGRRFELEGSRGGASAARAAAASPAATRARESRRAGAGVRWVSLEERAQGRRGGGRIAEALGVIRRAEQIE